MDKKNETKSQKEFRRWLDFWRVIEFLAIHPVLQYRKVGLKKKYDDRNYIFVGNHYASLDVVYPSVASSNPIHFMAKSSLWKNKLGKWFVTKSQCIPVERDGSDAKALIAAMRYLKAGENIGIFPEGTRNKTGEIFLPFKPGSAVLSIKTKTPIVPFVQLYKNSPFHGNYIIYGDPIEFSEYYDKKCTDEDFRACEERLREVMLNMRAEFLAKNPKIAKKVERELKKYAEKAKLEEETSGN